MDLANVLVPSSPTISSVSSSDLDTESTGSFFHDRSTTLGSLMGVTYPAASVPVASRRESNVVTGGVAAGRGGKPRTERRRGHGRRWWRLCRDWEASRATSLADFLEIERRFGDASAHRFLFGSGPAERNGLFADGRVLPPAEAAVSQSRAPTACRISGICCGCG